MSTATVITVRPTEPKDAPGLPAVERSAAQAFRQFPDLAWIANGDVQSTEKHLELIEAGASWVAVDSNDVPVGFLNGIYTDQDLYICEVSVHSDYQGKGIGRRLMEAARQWAVSCGCTSITLTTFQKIPWNEGFYKSLGFNTLNANELTPALYDIMNQEIEAGLPIKQRCAMRLLLV
ncbi:GCN5- N-acetyltransferase [Penicillium maclennaniae]|uniref:GCN5- N-acetyltransferase n=1 Tax=Penicillium maclennaniae TaxID=1343394 RepID=UPI00254070B0|nr:GCN5- N-acetyltransferase [Penicillium maclennaniae]KAJ5668197.1 GCN5- N-acetyltransferase [Penicillium maclennaniae]